MIDTWILSAAGGVLGFLAAFILKSFHRRVGDLEAWRLVVVETFVTVPEHNRAQDQIAETLTEMRDDIKTLLQRSPHE